jgi:hypothetical protein
VSIRIVPVNRDQAFAFIDAWHRHHAPPLGYRYALGVASGDVLVGVATVGRPVARHYDDGLTVEVTRVATDGTPHTCSALYGACWRAAKAMGYRRALTYTHSDESGASLRAAGWVHAATRAARHGWDMPGRPRSENGYMSVDRLLWLAEVAAVGNAPLQVSRPAEAEAQTFDLFTAAGVAS